MGSVWRRSDEAPEAPSPSRAPAHEPRAIYARAKAPTDTVGEGGGWLARHPRMARAGAVALLGAGVLRMAGVPPWLALLALPVGAMVPLLWRHGSRAQRRPKLEVADGSRWPWQWEAWRWQREVERECARLLSTWDAVAKAAGIDGAKLRKVVNDEEGYAVHVEAHGKLLTHVKLPLFASAAGIPVEWTIESPDMLRPWEFVIREAVRAGAAEDGSPSPGWTPHIAVDERAESRARLLEAIRAEGPVSGRRAAGRAGLGKDVGAELVRELLAEGLVRRVAGEGLVAVGA